MNWASTTLGEICERGNGNIQTGPFGSQLHQSDYKHVGTPVVMPKDIRNDKINTNTIARISEEDVERLSRHKLSKGDIVFPRRGEISKRALVTEKEEGWLCGTGCLKINVGRQIADPHFIFYYLGQKSVVAWIENQAIGATMANLNTSILKNVPVNLPSFLIQRNIVDVLSAYDKLIDNNNRRIDILEQMAEEIYKEWFVRLRFPGWRVVKIVDGVPEEWDNEFLRKHATYSRGKSYKSIDLTEKDGIPMVNLKCVKRGGGYRKGGLKYFNGDHKASHIVRPGDIILAVTDMTQNRDIVGRVALIPNNAFEHGIISMDLVKINPKGISSYFLYATLRYSSFGIQLKEFANGANVLHLNPELIYFQKILVPPLDLIERFENVLKPIFLEKDILSEKNEILKKTRDLLLPRLMSGKLNLDHVMNETEKAHL